MSDKSCDHAPDSEFDVRVTGPGIDREMTLAELRTDVQIGLSESDLPRIVMLLDDSHSVCAGDYTLEAVFLRARR
jgi:hypothetical protein